MAFTRPFLGQIYNGCNGRCYYCGIEVDPFSAWEPDHMLPRSQGGNDELSNLVLACRKCNRRKGGRDVEEYRNYIAERVEAKIQAAIDATEALPDFFECHETLKLKEHLTQAARYAPINIPFFYGEVNPLPRDAYAPLRAKTLDLSALDDPDIELESFELIYLHLKKVQGTGVPRWKAFPDVYMNRRTEAEG